MVNQALHSNPDHHAQSVIANHIPARHWTCPVYHEDTGVKQSIDLLLKGTDSPRWIRSLSNELGRLAQGIGQQRDAHDKMEGTNTIVFVNRHQIPTNAKITYANFVCDIRQHEKETHRIRLTVGGDRLDYHADPSAPAVGLLDTKIHINSTISDAKRGARYCVADIENYYLNNVLPHYQYMRIHIKYFTK